MNTVFTKTEIAEYAFDCVRLEAYVEASRGGEVYSPDKVASLASDLYRDLLAADGDPSTNAHYSLIKARKFGAAAMPGVTAR